MAASPLGNQHVGGESVSVRWRKMDEHSLVNLLVSQEGLDSVLELAGGDAAFVVNILDRALVSTSISPLQRKRCTVALRKLCGTRSILPASHLLSEGLEKIGDSPRASGGFADVWEGLYNEQTVAIKSLKTTMTDDIKKVEKSFCKEVLIWKRLSHPNILPFLGVANSPFQFGMVSPWMSNGNIVEYLKSHPKDYSIIGSLLSGIAEGLEYLHDNGLVHGDLKGANILIRDDHQACLADFGLMTIISDSLSAYVTTTVQTRGTTRWMAPELLLPEDFGYDHCSPSRQSDVYAFGMVVYEVLTGNIPFSKLRNFAVMLGVVKGKRPERPNDDVPLLDAVWILAEECWDQDQNKRPTIYEVVDRLKSAMPNVSPPHFAQMTENPEPRHEVDALNIDVLDADATPKEDELPVLTVDLKVMKKEREPPLGGHNGVVYSVTFSPDGELIASGGQDGTVRIWDAYLGKELKVLRGHGTKNVNSVAFSPDSVRIASGGNDRVVNIWNAHSGDRVLGPLTEHRDWVMSLQISPDGKTFVSGSDDGAVYVNSTTSGKRILGPLIHSQPVYSVAFSPNSARIISGSRDKTIRMWDARSGNMILGPLQHPEWIRTVAYSPNGMWIVSGCEDGNFRVWDANSGKLVLLMKGEQRGSIWSVAFSPDGKRVVSSGPASIVQVWEARTGFITKPLSNHGHLVLSVAFSPDGEWIVCGAGDGKIRLWPANDM